MDGALAHFPNASPVHGFNPIPQGSLVLTRPFIWLVLLLLPIAALAQQRYEVEIEGAETFSGLLREHLDIVRRADDTGLNPAEIQRRMQVAESQIRELLATQGYFSARVEPRLIRETDPWTVRFDISLGPPTIVESVDIRFSGALAKGPNADPERIRDLRSEWSLPPGEVFEQQAWTEAKNTLLNDLLLRGYPAASIAASQARIDPKTDQASLMVEFDSGPLFTFGELDIRGLERYSRAFIDRVNPIRPGEPYSQEKLNELQERVQETGYFRSAFAMVEIDPQNPKLAPVRVDVNELQRKRLSLGIGVSTDTGLRLQARWLDRNFLERDWRLESEILLDRETRLVANELYLRPLQNGWEPSLHLNLERTTAAGETNDKIRTGARLTSPNRVDEKAWAVSLIADRQRIGETFENNRQALIASFIYTKRRMDNPLNPRRGYIASAELGYGPAGLINEDSIARVVLRANALFPFNEKWRLQTRGAIGQLFGSDRQSVPADLLFRTGGDQTVRGYAFQTLGVRQNGATVGGEVMAIASAELIHQFTPEWGGAVFHDMGNAADSWGDYEAAHGTGVGVRWSGPLGQINFDVAYGHETNEPRIHFSIGYGF